MRQTALKPKNKTTNSSRSLTPLNRATPQSTTTTADLRVPVYQREDDKCPICKSDRYLNPKLRLLVSKCYHKMCESCIDRIFTLGPEPCPVCGTELRKTGFTAQTFEDLKVEKEVAIRKRIARCFNKRQHDFIDLKAYNDYLEEVEDITFNLINSVDVPETEARIKAYQKANAMLIASNARLDTTEADAQKILEARESAERAKRLQMMQRLEAEEQTARAEDEAELIELLEKTRDEKEAAKLLAKAKTESAARRKKTQQEIPEDWARLMGPSAPLPSEEDKENEALGPEDPLTNLKVYYDYSTLFELPRLDRGGGYTLDPWNQYTTPEEEYRLSVTTAGFKTEAVWERAVRSGVMGLFSKPLGWVHREDVVMSNE